MTEQTRRVEQAAQGLRATCSKPSCGRPVKALGLCQSCYRMHRYRTDPVMRERVLRQKARYRQRRKQRAEQGAGS